MKKMLLFSFFVSNNIGDIALSRKLAETYRQYFNICCVDFCTLERIEPEDEPSIDTNVRAKESNWVNAWIKKKRNGWGLLLKKEWIVRIEQYIKTSDIVCLGGGNMLMDLSFLPNFTYIAYNICRLAKAYDKDIVISHIGIGPFKTFLQKKYAQYVIKSCRFVSLRDPLSYQFAKLFTNRAVLSCDPAIINHFSLDLQNQNVSQRVIGVNVFCGIGGNRKRILLGYLNLINSLLQKDENAKIVLYATETMDLSDLKEMSTKISNKRVKIKEIATYRQLVEFYCTCSEVVAARMHAGIIAYSVGIHPVMLSWQNKVKAFAQSFDLTDRLFPIDTFSMNADKIADIVCHRSRRSVLTKDIHQDELENLYLKGVYKGCEQ